MRRRLVAHAAVLALLLASTATVRAADGVASWWHGDVAAVPGCTWPWDDCPPLRVTSHRTGLAIIVTPRMYCQCYVGTPDERLVDLTRSQVRALGLDLADGIYGVTVERVDPRSGLPSPALPDTRMEVPDAAS